MTITSAVETATIEIRTLTVNGRRMSAGYLKQLVERPVINTAGHIDGTPWGTVNYHPDGCSAASEHLHVVWQSGDELRRAYVGAPENAHRRHPLAGEYVMARIAEGARRDVKGNISICRATTGNIVTRCTVRGMSFVGTATPSFLNAWDLYGFQDDLAERLQRSFAENFGHPLRPSAEIAELLPVDAYKESWRTLCDLPQLFIGS